MAILGRNRKNIHQNQISVDLILKIVDLEIDVDLIHEIVDLNIITVDHMGNCRS